MSELKVTVTDKTLVVQENGSELIFELVDEVPPGHMVWNIGRHMAPGYLPLCRLLFLQPFEGARRIDPDSLKAIRIDGAEHILKATGWAGDCTVSQMEQYVKDHRDDEDECARYQAELFEKAIPVMKRIKWNNGGKCCG